jgi:hypothetical protein
MVTEIEVRESPDLTLLEFWLWGWMNSEVYRRNENVRDELLALSLDAAARIKKHEDELRRTTRHLRTQVAKCIDFEGGIFEHLFVNNNRFVNYL